MGIVATALWLIGRAEMLPDLADPQHDLGALEMSIRQAKKRGVRTKPSVQKRLGSD